MERRGQRKKEMYDFISKIKSVPCQDCGNSYPSYVMDFDHRVPSEKTAEIGKVISNGSWPALYAEIDKCDIICANCHRIRTHR